MQATDEGFILNVELFVQLTAKKGWRSDRARAAGIGVNRHTIWRARNRVGTPSPAFMAKATETLGVSVDALFPRRTPVGVR